MIDLTKVSELKFDKVIDKIEDINGLIIYEAWRDLIASGVPALTLLNCKGVDLIDYKLYGNSIQDDTPTPDTPIEVESVGEKSKNLFKQTELLESNSESNTYYNSDDKGVTLLQADTSSWTKKNTILTLPAGDYTISNTESNTARVQIYDSDNISLLNAYSLPATFTLTQETPLKIKILSINPTYPIFIGNIQIEEGTTATDYEPYGYKIPVTITGRNLFDLIKDSYEPYVEPITTNIYLNEPLRKILDYADYIDFENGKVVRNIHSQRVKLGNVYMTGTNWQRTGATSVYSGILEKNGATADIKNKQLSNMFKSGTWNNSETEAPYNYVLCGNKSYTFYCIIENSYLENITDESSDDEKKAAVKNFFDNNEVYVDYILETPIEETIELPNIPTLKGTTTLSVDTEIQPSNLEVVYKGKEVKE